VRIERMRHPSRVCRAMALLSIVAAFSVSEVHSEVLRDPTQPLDYVVLAAPDTESALRLESVLIAPERRLATINGETVSVNQLVSGAKVIEIVAGSVTIIAKGQRQQLFVSKPLKMMKKASAQ